MIPRFARLIILLVFAPFATATAATSPFVGIPVAGTLTNASNQTVTFNGTVDVTGFTFAGTVIDASGMLTGDISSGGSVVETVGPIRIEQPVTFATATCQKLSLQLAPFGPATFFVSNVAYTGLIATTGSSPPMIVVPDITPSSNQVRGVLCRIAEAVADGGPASGIASQLNLLVRLLA